MGIVRFFAFENLSLGVLLDVLSIKMIIQFEFLREKKQRVKQRWKYLNFVRLWFQEIKSVTFSTLREHSNVTHRAFCKSFWWIGNITDSNISTNVVRWLFCVKRRPKQKGLGYFYILSSLGSWIEYDSRINIIFARLRRACSLCPDFSLRFLTVLHHSIRT